MKKQLATAIATCFLALPAAADTWFDDSRGEPMVEEFYAYDEAIIIDSQGKIVDFLTGRVLSYQEAEQIVTRPFPIGVAILVNVGIGAGGGAVAVGVQGGSGAQVLSGAFFGAVTGYYGALATASAGVATVLYGSAAIGTAAAGAAADKVVSAHFPATGPGGNCKSDADSDKCKLAVRK
jgi:hypothetical protein